MSSIAKTKDARSRAVQNTLGLSVFFNWGVIEHNGAYNVAVIAGGWNEALVLVSLAAAHQPDFRSLWSVTGDN